MKTLFHGVGYMFDGIGCLADAVDYITDTVNDILRRVEYRFIAYLKKSVIRMPYTGAEV